MSYVTTARLAKSDRLFSVLAGYQGCLIVTHDNPDPDAIASGWALKCLITEKLGLPAQFVGSGAIVRAENRAHG
jgi:nanoRNase/pAp phosphatase (c-di-AMP/oligoRNAs hydrolase)